MGQQGYGCDVECQYAARSLSCRACACGSRTFQSTWRTPSPTPSSTALCVHNPTHAHDMGQRGAWQGEPTTSTRTVIRLRVRQRRVVSVNVSTQAPPAYSIRLSKLQQPKRSPRRHPLGVSVWLVRRESVVHVHRRPLALEKPNGVPVVAADTHKHAQQAFHVIEFPTGSSSNVQQPQHAA